jgi:hypothetical protein
MMQHIGPEKRIDSESQLFYAMNEGYSGVVWDYPNPRSPPEGVEFVKSQFERFNVKVPPEISPILSFGLNLLIVASESIDPYMLFCGYSDVECTLKQHMYTYEIKEDSGRVFEARPEDLEVYVWDPDQSKQFFEEHINIPGVANLPYYIRSTIEHAQDLLAENLYEYGDEGDRFTSPRDLAKKIEELCEGNLAWVEAYFDLSIWAGVLWLLGPLSARFRFEYSDIVNQAMTHSEILLYQGSIYTPHEYIRTDRLPQSCYKCGLSSYCVERTLDDEGVFRMICEHCSSQGALRFQGATCGQRFCKYFECHYNLYYNDVNASRMGMRSYGQLAQKVAQRKNDLAIQAQGNRRCLTETK